MSPLRNLARNASRTLLTMFVIALGVSLMVSSLTILQSLEQSTTDLLGRYRIDLVVQEANKANPIRSRIRPETVEHLGGFPGVVTATPIVLDIFKADFNPFFLLIGLPSGDWVSANVGLDAGRPFAPGANEIMLGRRVAKRLDLGPGDKIQLADDKIFEVVGIYVSGHSMMDGGAALDLSIATQMRGKDSEANLVLISADQADDVEELGARIQTVFPELETVSRGAMLQQVEVFKAIDQVTYAISVIALLTCVLVAANTLSITVLERTWEIGILAACGWSPSRILLGFLQEALLLGFGGSLLGILLAQGVILMLQYSDRMGIGWIPTHPDWQTAVLAIALAILSALAGALVPALRAASVDPAEALRHE